MIQLCSNYLKEYEIASSSVDIKIDLSISLKITHLPLYYNLDLVIFSDFSKYIAIPLKMDYLAKLLEPIIGSNYEKTKKDDDFQKKKKKTERDLESGASEDGEQKEVTKKKPDAGPIPRYKAVIYDFEIQDALAYRKNLLENFSEEFLKALEMIPEEFVRSNQVRGVFTEYWMIEDYLINTLGVLPPSHQKHSHPLFETVRGTVTKTIKTLMSGNEESFEFFDLESSLIKDGEEFFVTEVMIGEIKCNRGDIFEMCLTDGQNTHEWIPFDVAQSQPRDTNIDTKVESELKKTIPQEDNDQMLFSANTYFPSLLYGSSMVNKNPVVKNNIWNLYLGDKTPQYIEELFVFTPSTEYYQKSSVTGNVLNQKVNTEEEEERWGFIVKNFSTFLILHSIKDSNIDSEYFPNLKKAIERSLLKSVDGWYRIEEKYAKIIKKITMENTKRSTKGKIGLKIRHFDYQIKSATIKSMRTNPNDNSTESKFEIPYSVTYRKIGTEAALLDYKQKLDAEIIRRKNQESSKDEEKKDDGKEEVKEDKK